MTNTEIYTSLKTRIMTLDLEPGDIISEIDMSKKFNISRTPIREVFKRLEYDGLVNVIKNKGTEITPISSQQAYKTHIYTGLNVFHQLIETKPHYFIS
ncbi:MAG: hypothetical protein ATN33_04265 [Epulopiscium sp. Nele67-Bin001]|nr:MAG: hypothetical protein ATN33_04265 [Epulopiscium sp. Nele67-Bin001]